jgi:hypothetical protein
MRIRQWARSAPLAVALVATGCAGGLDVLGDILAAPGPQGEAGIVTVEVREVRERSQEIIVRTQAGQQGPVLYDQNTQVIYQNQQYPVRALELGDIVDMRVQQIQQGYYTDRIEVRTPVQDRQAGTPSTPGTTDPNVYRVEGTLGAIDTQNWTFELNMTQGGTVLVVLPEGAPAATRDRVRQHRAGDYVRVEIRPVDQQRAELVRFGWS